MCSAFYFSIFLERLMTNTLKSTFKRTLLGAAAAVAVSAAFSLPSFAADKPTIILVHGAFAASDSWDGVVKILKKDGYSVISAANPLRSVKGDAAYVGALATATKGDVVMVGHSYGGTVITNAATGKTNVKALVYVGAFSPDAGEAVVDLAGKFPGSTLGDTLNPVKLADGNTDLYIQQAKFHKQFAADVPAATAALMAVAQRPITESAILEKAAEPAWKTIPSWHIYGTADKNIPAAAMKFMAERAKAKQTVEIAGASHVPHVTHPAAVAKMIEAAAK
jgi:pimeloyl-ACP methyl ester carboxylesterase